MLVQRYRPFTSLLALCKKTPHPLPPNTHTHTIKKSRSFTSLPTVCKNRTTPQPHSDTNNAEIHVQTLQKSSNSIRGSITTHVNVKINTNQFFVEKRYQFNIHHPSSYPVSCSSDITTSVKIQCFISLSVPFFFIQ